MENTVMNEEIMDTELVENEEAMDFDETYESDDNVLPVGKILAGLAGVGIAAGAAVAYKKRDQIKNFIDKKKADREQRKAEKKAKAEAEYTEIKETNKVNKK